MTRYVVTITLPDGSEKTHDDIETAHWKFYGCSTSKYCPLCQDIWAQIWMEGSLEAWPEICYCETHASQATTQFAPGQYSPIMPIPGSILDAWACSNLGEGADFTSSDPLDDLPESLIRREFNLYLRLIDLGVLHYEQPATNTNVSCSSALDSWLQNPS